MNFTSSLPGYSFYLCTPYHRNMQSNINYDDPSSMTASYTANSEKPNSPSPELWALDTATCNSVFGDTELSMQHPYSQQINEQLNYQRQVFDPQPLMLDQQAFSTALTSTDVRYSFVLIFGRRSPLPSLTSFFFF